MKRSPPAKIKPTITSKWKFKHYILFENGHKDSVYSYPGEYEDEYGSTVGSFEKDIEELARELQSQPVAYVVEFWLEETSIWELTDEEETTYTINRKLHKQQQINKRWWCKNFNNMLSEMLEDPSSITNNVVCDVEKWKYSNRGRKYK